jgi:hypothetical protein
MRDQTPLLLGLAILMASVVAAAANDSYTCNKQSVTVATPPGALTITFEFSRPLARHIPTPFFALDTKSGKATLNGKPCRLTED